MNIKIRIYMILIVIVISLQCCISNNFHVIKKYNVKQFESYSLETKSPLYSRVKPAPEIIIKAWGKWDKRDNYSSYIPKKNEMRIIRQSIALLPKKIKRIMKKRLIGIYFINNLMGSGLADWVKDKNNKLYFYMLFNPSVFKKNISQLISSKEMTCFIPNDSNYKIEVDCGNKYNGFLYIMLHESAHILDYATYITPYVEPHMINFKKGNTNESPFTKNVWISYSKPVKKFSSIHDVTFYGWNGGPKIKISEAVKTYKALSKTPFISLYGTLNWAEDLAEQLTYYHLVKKLKTPFTINILSNNKIIHKYKPTANPRVKKRFPILESTFY